MNGRFENSSQSIQKLEERLTLIISSVQDKQNELLFCRFLSTSSPALALQDKRYEPSFHGILFETCSKIRTDNTNHFAFLDRQKMNGNHHEFDNWFKELGHLKKQVTSLTMCRKILLLTDSSVEFQPEGH